MNDSSCCGNGDANKQLVERVRDSLPDPRTMVELAQIFKALGDPTRASIVAALAQQELCVGDLAAVLDMSVSAISHHLRLLRSLRIVHGRREGRHLYYLLDDEHIIDIYRCGLDHVRHS